MVTLEKALKENSISQLMQVPKSDIHSHGGKGGRIKYIAEWANAPIKASEQPFDDLDAMQNWFNSNIKIHDNGKEGYLKRVEAAFAQAKEELSQPIKNFQKIYRKAQRYGVKLKAHVGEFGTAEDVREAVELLELSEVHHGIAAVNSKDVMSWLSKHKIQLNICPTSNIMLKRALSFSEHPIKEFFENGIPVTINTDDLLIFDSSVSEEYLKLYTNNVFSIGELEIIRQTGLRSYK